ncbi:MAG TPA: hypothetical protein DCL38_06575 [Lachnospiraceae bacterium]|nr:hypothetical protein [Lachnospiraceae bacterium]
MDGFYCNECYKADLTEFSEQVLNISGVASPNAEREIMYLADAGNTVALKLCADLVFYRKILRRRPYSEAFALYLRSSDIVIGEDGGWRSQGSSYPVAYWMLGYYLVNYKRESGLKHSETIETIEGMTIEKRLETAFYLALSCIEHIDVPGAYNLIGRILKEISEDTALFNSLGGQVSNALKESGAFKKMAGKVDPSSASGLSGASELFFKRAASEGYVYACNNLAAREAGAILALAQRDKEDPEIPERVRKYTEYLKRAADKYEPYAANRLGLFYINGEIRGSEGSFHYRRHIAPSLAKDYFMKATVYPDANSAWAYYNLIRYFHKDYDSNIDLLNEHMSKIKELNPRIYELAIEL